MKFLLKKGVIHCDLKPENILFKNYTCDSVKVIDFGSSSFIDDIGYTYLQTRPYRAPEMVFGCPFDSAIDIWSLGCILYELFVKKVLFNFKRTIDNVAKAFSISKFTNPYIFKNGTNYDKLVYKNMLCQKNHSHINTFDFETIKPNYNFNLETELLAQDCDKDLIDLILRCLEVDPRKRISVDECLKHPFIQCV